MALLFMSFSTIYSDEIESIKFIKRNRIDWRNENFLNNLIKESKLSEHDDFIFIEEYNTNFTEGLIILNKEEYYYFENKNIIMEKIEKPVINELLSFELNNTNKTNLPERDKSFYSVFIKKGKKITYAIFDDLNNSENDKNINN